MPKLLLHDIEARRALAAGVGKLAAAVEPTLGPKGMNAMIDRPIGTPFISRDGVSIASEIELFDRFENMGAQVVREVSMQTNEVAGDGTTTAIVLANALIQKGVEALDVGGRPVDVCKGIDQAVAVLVEKLKSSARPVTDGKVLERVAEIAATDPDLGALVAEAFNRIGADGVITTDYGVTTETVLDIVEGMSFDRGYISHHMVTDVEQMLAVLDDPYVVITDQKIKQPAQLDAARAIADADNKPLLIIAEEVQPEVVVMLLDQGGAGKYVVVHPPEYGQWRQAMLDDLAILLGGKVLARDLGKRLEDITREDLGQCDQVRVSSNETVIIRGKGDAKAIAARRKQVQRQFELAPPNIEQDKLRERLAKLSGGTAIIYAGGVTPVEQKRTIQLIDDALNAVRAASEEGVVSGGGSALIHCDAALDEIASQAEGDVARGIQIVRDVLSQPLTRIAQNAGRDPQEIVAEVRSTNSGHGYNAATGEFVNMYDAGIIDPVRATYSALTNAASVATLILTTETLIGDLGEDEDPTSGPALGGGAENLGRE
ncbi:MAG: molecular chaperone GroEL [Hyphomicrobiales bacterium]